MVPLLVGGGILYVYTVCRCDLLLNKYILWGIPRKVQEAPIHILDLVDLCDVLGEFALLLAFDTTVNYGI